MLSRPVHFHSTKPSFAAPQIESGPTDPVGLCSSAYVPTTRYANHQLTTPPNFTKIKYFTSHGLSGFHFTGYGTLCSRALPLL